MGNLEHILYQKILSVMSTWDEEDIYAVSFFVYSNEVFSFRDYFNVPSFSVSYNTESDCGGAGPHSEERWNYAYWRQDETPIIEPDDDSPEMLLLFDWYREQGIEDIGYEDKNCPDGPVGYPELVDLAAKIARRFQEEGFLKKKFGRPIPIIIHDLEYVDCTLKATEYANPNGEASDFLHGSWRSAVPTVGPFPSVGNLVSDILNDPEKQAKLFAASPRIPQEYMMEMLKKLSAK